MPTVIFDLDSTLLSSETLEEGLAAKSKDPQTIKKIKEITEKGMAGKIDFLSSVKQRLDEITLSKRDIAAMITAAEKSITPGMPELVRKLLENGIDIWIISGALKNIVVATAQRLSIPEDHCLGIELLWDEKGNYSGIDDALPINRSKWEGAQAVAAQWSKPSVVIGDGMTDYSLFEQGLCNSFIAFTEHKRREALLRKEGTLEAKNVSELKKLLEELIHVHL